MSPALLELVGTISQSLTAISDHAKNAGITLPTPGNSGILPETERYLLNDDLAVDVKKVVASALQLIECLTPVDGMLIRLSQMVRALLSFFLYLLIYFGSFLN